MGEHTRRKWPLRALIAGGMFVALAMLGLGGVLWLLGRLETPAVRDRVRAELQGRFGVEADYERLDLSPFGGLVVRGITIASPGRFKERAPVLASLGDLEVGWDLAALAGGALQIERVRISGVRATIVIDRDTGQSSLQLLAEGLPKSDEPPPPSEPPGPISGQLAAVKLPPGLRLGEFELTDVHLRLEEVEGGSLVRSVEFEGIELTAKMNESDGGFTAELGLGAADSGVRVRIVEGDVEREIVLRPSFRLAVDSKTGITLEGRIDLIRQSFDDRLPAEGAVLDAKLTVTFEPAEGRTRVQVERLDLLDGAARITADAIAIDGPLGTMTPGALTVSATLALAKLLALAPEGLVPVSLKSGEAQLDVQELTLDPTTFMPTGGSLKLQVGLQGLRADQGSVAKLELTVSGASVRREGADTEPGDTYVIDVNVKSRGISAKAGPNAVRLAAAQVDVTVRDLAPRLDDPLASKADMSIKARFDGLDARTPQGRIQAVRIELTADASDPWRPPYAGRLTVPITGLQAHAPGGRTLLKSTDGRIAVKVSKVLPPRRGSVEADVVLGALKAHLTASSGKALTYAVTVDAPSLGIVRPFAPASLGIRWDRLGVSLKASGRVRNAFQPRRLSAEHETELRVIGLSIRQKGLSVSADRIELKATGRGGQKAHQIDLDLILASPAYQNWKGGKRHELKLKADFDLSAPKGKVDMTLRGEAGPEIELAFDAAFDKKAARMIHALSFKASKLGGLRPLVPPEVLEEHAIDLGRLSLEVTAKGATDGVIKRFKRGTTPVLAADPAAAFRGRQELSIRVGGVRYAGNGVEIETPEIRVALELSADDDGVTPAIKLSTPSLRTVFGGKTLVLSNLSLDASGRLDALPTPDVADFRVELKLGEAIQEFVPGYPVGGVALSARGRLQRGELIRLDSFTLTNDKGGTALDLSGTIEMGGAGGGGLVPGREAVELEGAFSQDLEALRGLPWFGDVRGEVGLRLQASSGDRRRFRVAASLTVQGVDVELPEQGISIAGVDGNLPVLQEILIDEEGQPRLVMGARTDAWSRARFQDVHPFLAGDNYLSIRKITVNGRSAGPLAGNVRVDRNLFSVDQLQAKLLGGDVSGQLLVDITEGAREIRFRGAVTGIQPTQGDDRLDANTAFVLRPDTLHLEGRVQLVRIGKQHLLDLLDLIDPYAEDVAINRARVALQVGYPEKVRLRFDDGFLTASLKLGGLAGLAKIDDIRGVPMGPPLQRFLGPLLAKRKTP